MFQPDSKKQSEYGTDSTRNPSRILASEESEVGTSGRWMPQMKGDLGWNQGFSNRSLRRYDDRVTLIRYWYVVNRMSS